MSVFKTELTSVVYLVSSLCCTVQDHTLNIKEYYLENGCVCEYRYFYISFPK